MVTAGIVYAVSLPNRADFNIRMRSGKKTGSDSGPYAMLPAQRSKTQHDPTWSLGGACRNNEGAKTHMTAKLTPKPEILNAKSKP